MLDLGELFGDDGKMPKASEVLVDKSNRPQPTRAIVHLTSGIQVDADVRYTGTAPFGDRKYAVIAEINWDTDNVALIEIDRWPADVTITLRVPDGVSDERCMEIGHSINWRVAGQSGYQPRYIRRTP